MEARVTASSQAYRLKERMEQAEVRHGQEIRADLPGIRVRASAGAWLGAREVGKGEVFFCNMGPIRLRSVTIAGDGMSLPNAARVQGLNVAADGTLTIKPGCRLRLTNDDLKTLGELVEKAKPREWKPSYVTPTNPTGCCDMIGTTLTITRRGSKWTSTWFDDHLPLPPDLDAIVSTLWAPNPTTIRGRYKAQCKP